MPSASVEIVNESNGQKRSVVSGRGRILYDSACEPRGNYHLRQNKGRRSLVI